MDWKKEKLRLNELREQRIKLSACQHRKLYRLLARNIKIGVWNDERQEFLGIREKFGSRFIDSENHWDAPNFATACPLEVIGELPEDISLEDCFNSKPLFSFLEEEEKKLAGEPIDSTAPSH